MKWTEKTIPSLSRYLDTLLTAEVVPGPVSSRENQLFSTFTFPTEEIKTLSAKQLNELYFQPVIQSMAVQINNMGKVKTAPLPIPEDFVGVNCIKGKIPVSLFVVRHNNPDRHQFIITILVEPVNEQA